jgi:hypothetical protein
MKNFLNFFGAIGMTALIYITTVVTPALIGCILFGDWGVYLKCVESPDYMAGMSFISLFAIIIYWAYETDN